MVSDMNTLNWVGFGAKPQRGVAGQSPALGVGAYAKGIAPQGALPPL